jgi:protoporphyrinogen oxidase
VSTGRVIVVGGGLAGIAAALDCADAGAEVTLVEVRPRLGGAAYSVSREGLQMDNGQHVFMRCCESYRALLERLGSGGRVRVQERLRVPVLRPGHAPAVVQRNSLPAPAHLALTVARYRHLPLRSRVLAARAMLALMRLRPGTGHELDREAFGDWLARHGQSPHAIEMLWDLIALPTLNLPAEEASLELAAFVFRTALLTNTDAGDIGFHEDTLAATIGTPAEQALVAAGVRVLLGWRARRLVRSAAAGGFELQGSGGTDEPAGDPEGGPSRDPEGRPSSEDGPSKEDRQDGAGLSAEAVIVALPHERAAGLLEPLLGADAERWRSLPSSPIVNLHVVYDREVLGEHFVAGIDTPVQYLFDRSRAGGAPSGSQYLAVSLSGAREEMTMSVDELRRRYEPALSQLLPRARHARIESFLVTREHAATFAGVPGSAALRPAAQTGVDGLALAGTWTATGWPATLESAVLSGHTAARAALVHLHGRAPQQAAALARG